MSDISPDSVAPETETAATAADTVEADPGSDVVPQAARVLLYGSAEARAAMALLGRDYDNASASDFVARLASGDYEVVVAAVDPPPDGEWQTALLDFIVDGGAVVLGASAPDERLAATFGASLGDTTDGADFTPTWRDPVWATPNDLGHANFEAASSAHGVRLTPTAGRTWARFAGGGALVESNGGRTMLAGFAWRDYPGDSDGDDHEDVVELIANLVTYVSDPPEPGPQLVDFATDRSEVVSYDLPIIRGAAESWRVTATRGSDVRSWPVADRRFKALVPLEPGDNYVTLRAADGLTHLQIRLEPRLSGPRVRVVYAIASDGNGEIDAPAGEPHDTLSATRRLALGARLLQSIVADRLNDYELGRRTFRLAPGVEVWRTSLATADWWAMSGQQMWDWVYAHLGDLPPCDDCKTIVMLGMTHYDSATSVAYAHTALGGGALALFGSGTLYAWPESLDQLEDRLADQRRATELGLFDDSGYRGTVWANFATGLGAVLHELGHALDLPHATDYETFMSRGFDHINRLLTSSEPTSLTTPAIDAIWGVDEPSFDFHGIHRLRWHRWLAEVPAPFGEPKPSVVFEPDARVRIHSDYGLALLTYSVLRDGDWRTIAADTLSEDEALYTLAYFRFRFPLDPTIRLLVTDEHGNFNDDTIVTLP